MPKVSGSSSSISILLNHSSARGSISSSGGGVPGGCSVSLGGGLIQETVSLRDNVGLHHHEAIVDMEALNEETGLCIKSPCYLWSCPVTIRVRMTHSTTMTTKFEDAFVSTLNPHKFSLIICQHHTHKQRLINVKTNPYTHKTDISREFRRPVYAKNITNELSNTLSNHGGKQRISADPQELQSDIGSRRTCYHQCVIEGYEVLGHERREGCKAERLVVSHQVSMVVFNCKELNQDGEETNPYHYRFRRQTNRDSDTVSRSNIINSKVIKDTDNIGAPEKSVPIRSSTRQNSAVNEERVNKSRAYKVPKFSLCCMQGKLVLPKQKRPPSFLEKLLTNNDSRSKQFFKKIRSYNNMFAFTSMGGKIDHSVNNGKGPYVFRLNGQNMHLMGGLLPCQDERPRFSQLYTYDTDNEVSNRLRSAGSIRERAKSSNIDNLRLRLIKKQNTDSRVYNLPTASEVAALTVGDFDIENVQRDIIDENKSGLLQRIHEMHPLYLPMQYPLLFPYGQDGYHDDTEYRDSSIPPSRKQRNLTMKQYFCYILKDRRTKFNIFLRCGKLTQQLIVNGYTMIECQRLSFIRLHQTNLHAYNYSSLAQGLARGESMSSAIGFPDLFITFTCNPKWPELCRLFEVMQCTSEDKPDILTRVFKIKLNALWKDITKNGLFGKCRAGIYTIEFQKRGLPHAHILIWLCADEKFNTTAQIDTVISTENPNPETEP
ncbi:uncharacterized protein G2W53_033099 [Senna tora]|uniref:Helitron helicase-like domain-containing protein n=1 Tax=Senna tora TaxID=362788 RepID=A0A834SX16_9FABA|nr:uncharacterized protein G2W53_033099 [Senna tora]